MCVYVYIGSKPRGNASPDKDGEAVTPLPTPDEVAQRIRTVLHAGAITHLTRLTVTSLIPLEAADLQGRTKMLCTNKITHLTRLTVTSLSPLEAADLQGRKKII